LDLVTYEHRFRRAGLPTLIEDQSAREDVWTRAAPVLGLVLVVELVLAGNSDWAWWLNGLALIGGVVALAAVVALVNRHRRRPAFALPDDVGPVELTAFVLVGGAIQFIGGQPTSAAVVVGVNLLVLAVLRVWIVYGVAWILAFTGRRVGTQLAAAVDLLARAIPLLLLFSVVLFVNTEMWEVFSSMDDPTLAAAIGLVVVVGAVFLAVRLPREVGRLEAQVGAEPRLDRRQRTNVGLVLLVSQALQVAIVAAAVGSFFVAFGALAIGPQVIESWIGVRGSSLLAFGLAGVDVRITEELLRVACGIATLSGLYYSVAVLTDAVYRDEFLRELTEDLQAVFTDRARYLDLRSEMR
jgi:hypothetical protein